MCGVIAVLGSTDITRSMELLAHRGIRSDVMPTSAGTVGHVRLPIVGLDAEHDQPVMCVGWTIGFVGELLDFREHCPGMECDVDLVAITWATDGPEGFRKFDGFWGIAAIHNTDRTLHVLTDYLGQKPMYYRADVPSAASEPDALVPLGPVTLDEVYLSAVIKWGYCPDLVRTPYSEIRHVLPGEYVIIRAPYTVDRYFTDPIVPVPYHQPDTDIRKEIEAAVKRRVLSSDVQTACLVSGGLDSAIVYTLAKRHGQPVPYFVSESEADPEYWEALGVVRGTAKAFSYEPMVPRIEQNLRRSLWSEVTVQEALAIMQEPIDLGSLRPQIALSRAVRERVCLTGDGADELFGGYQRSQRYDSQNSDVFQELPAWHLPRLDRVMMRQRIEVRSPFLARRVVQMALSLPHEMRQDKRYLRGIFGDVLPPRICEKPKKALRVSEIERDREGYSAHLVHLFREKFNAKTT